MLLLQPKLDSVCFYTGYPDIKLFNTMLNNKLQPAVPFCGVSNIPHMVPAIGAGYFEPFED